MNNSHSHEELIVRAWTPKAIHAHNICKEPYHHRSIDPHAIHKYPDLRYQLARRGLFASTPNHHIILDRRAYITGAKGINPHIGT